MKKTLCMVALIAVVASCSKHKKYCWQCTATYTLPQDTTLPKSKTVKGIDAYCNKTTDEIHVIEGLSFESADAGYGLQTYSNCTKK